MQTRQKVGLIAVVISMVVGVISAILVVGREARLVDVLTLFFSGLAAGAGLVSAIRRKKSSD